LRRTTGILRAILAIPLILSPAAAAEIPAKLKDFGLGSLAGECLTAKCEVFRGTMLTESPKPGVPVEFKVQEWLLGEHTPDETVGVPYDDHLPKSMSFGTPGAAWHGVKSSTGAAATVMMALETNGQIIAGQPVLVTFDDREGELIRSLVAEASRLKKTPELISAEVASLTPNSSPALASFLLCYSLQSRDVPRRDVREELLLRLIGNPALPFEAWQIIPRFMTLMYYSSPTPEGKTRIVQRFVDLALSEDDNAAEVGLSGLAGLALHPESGLRDLLPSAAVPVIAARYRALVAKNRVSHAAPLESMLGVQ
jgi:hypothetical protein